MAFEWLRRRRIAREAADWHSRMLEPSSEAEVQAFQAWLEADPAHSQSYAAFEGVSALGERLPRRALAAAEGRSQPRPFRAGFALAAVAVLLALGCVWLVVPGSQRAEAAISNFGPSVRAVRLNDGTAVILDSGAELTLGSRRGDPDVTLRRGRVRFRVLAGAAEPFAIATRGAIVRARNSVLDVSLDREATQVRVLRGEAEVAANGDGPAARQMSVTAGQGAEVRDRQVSPTSAAPYDTRWPAARMGFEDAPLAIVAAKANAIGGPKIEVPDAKVAGLRLTGVLDLRDTRALARKLAATFDLRVEERHGAILLRRRTP